MLDPRSPFTGAQLRGGLDAFNSMDVEDELFQVQPFTTFVLQASDYPGSNSPNKSAPFLFAWACSSRE